jgi:hypothetical protein
MWTVVRENLKTTVALATTLVAISSGIVYAYDSFCVTRVCVTAQVNMLRDRVIDTQVQLHQTERSLLRKEQLDRELQLQGMKDPATRGVIITRQRDIADELVDIDRKIRELIREKRK